MGISVNASSLTTSIGSLTYAQGRRAVITNPGGGIFAEVNVTLYLTAGDVVRPHNNTTVQPNDTTSVAIFNITKVSN